MNIFQTDICPLCKSVLQKRPVRILNGEGVTIYNCHREVEDNSELQWYGKITHYEVEVSKEGFEVQHICMMPWAIDSYLHTQISRLYKFELETLKWRFIIELPIIKATDEKSMRERINLLAIFL